MSDDEYRRVMERRPATSQQENAPNRSPSVLSSVSLLYVDANGPRQREVRDALERGSSDVEFEVTVVSDYDSAIDLFEREDVDCIVSAYHIDGGDGLTLLQEIRDAVCDIPFVLVTDDGSEQLASEAIRANVTEYISTFNEDNAVTTLPYRIVAAIERQRECVITDRLDGIEEAVEHAADAIVITDDEGTIEYVNPAFEEITGYSRAEALDRNPRILKSGEHDQQYYEALWDSILEGEVWEEEVVNETKSGDRYIAHQTITPVTDCDGTVRRFVGIQRDVTRQKQLEEQVEKAASTLSHVYEVTSDTELSFQAKLESVLEIASRHLDFPIGYITHIDEGEQHILAAVGDHEEIQTDATDPLEQTYCRHTIERSEPVVLSDALEEGWESDPAYEQFGLRCYLGARVKVDGEAYGTLCFGGTAPKDRFGLESQQSTVRTLAKWLGYEIERHQYEQRLERKNERLDDFASLVSHDLRNPLNVAKAHLELAIETGDDDSLTTVGDAHDRIEAIIDDTLTLAQQGDVVESTRTVSLAELVTDCWKTVETSEATLQLTDDATLECDPGRLRHVLENLFRNATEHAGDQVTVEVGPTDSGFYVADDGPGIDPNQRDQIFQSGYTSGEGTGLGLSIVQRITEAHGWSLSITESSSGGARFEFTTGATEHNDENAPLVADHCTSSD